MNSHTPRPRTRLHEHGFTVTELAMVVAVIGIITAVMTPLYLSYLRAATVEGAAQEVATLLNQGRSLAISRNQSVCVQTSGARIRYAIGGCGSATFYTGPGTDGNGFIRLSDGVNLTMSASPVFTSLGAAAPGATFTVTHAQYPSASLPVTVAASGRVRIGS